jgi:hypothetical protein
LYEPSGRPREKAPPLGHLHDTTSDSTCTSPHRLRPRVCLRKGCDRVYQPVRWNQRYCQHPECRKDVARWQAAKRQQQRRLRPEVRQQHAAAERERRARLAANRHVPAVRGAEAQKADRAWSRRRKKISAFCDRPGCYEPRREACRCPTKYCGDECRQAYQRVLDRERKWLRRKELSETSPDGCQGLQQRLASGTRKCSSANSNPAHSRTPVVDYRSCAQKQVSFLDSDFQPLEEPEDDRETSSAARSRAPPS